MVWKTGKSPPQRFFFLGGGLVTPVHCIAAAVFHYVGPEVGLSLLLLCYGRIWNLEVENVTGNVLFVNKQCFFAQLVIISWILFFTRLCV